MIERYAKLAELVAAAAGRPQRVPAKLRALLGVEKGAFWRICADPDAHGCDADHLARWRGVVAEWAAALPPERKPGRPRRGVDEAAHIRAEMAR